MGNKFYHHGSRGDIIYSLPTVIALGGGALYSREPILRDLGALLHVQPYLEEVREYDKEKDDGSGVIFMDKYRKIAIGDPMKNLVDCHAEAFGVKVDRSVPWLFNITPNPAKSIVINRTFRYRSNSINWKLLQPYHEHILFVGYEQEWMHFKNHYFNVDYFSDGTDALKIGEVIAGSRLYVGNQSMCYAIAEGLKVRRVLEVHSIWKNCMPCESTGGTALSDTLIKRCLSGN